MVASDDNSTSSSLVAFLDLVYLVQPFSLVSSLELLSEIVVTDTSGVNDRARGQYILFSVLDWVLIRNLLKKTHSSTTRSVLSRASSHIGDLVLLDELIIAVDNI
jgi:hypothetical protein